MRPPAAFNVEAPASTASAAELAQQQHSQPEGQLPDATSPSRDFSRAPSFPSFTGRPAPTATPLQEGEEEVELLKGWRHSNNNDKSLPEVNGSVQVPSLDQPWYAKMFAFAGVGSLIAVGYMDPGNWATDIAGGASFGYKLLVVIMLSNFTAMMLQAMALKLGIVAERDLAQACRDAFNKYVNVVLWLLMEVAIVATDLAEIIGSATAMNLLFGIPLWVGVLITVADVLFIIFFGTRNFRLLEILVITLCALIGGCFVYELATAKPVWRDVFSGFIPRGEIITNKDMLYVAIGIIGATVMPHNLFLHSSIVQTRAYPRTRLGMKMAIRYNTWDTCLSLLVAFFINAAILILAAAAFHFGSHADHTVADISTAFYLLSPSLGTDAARILFGVALLAAGQNATITGTLAGQVVMEGFVQIKIKPWLRRLITRLVAMVPAAVVAGIYGNTGAGRLLVMSQVILSLCLPFAVIPLVFFTNSKSRMGRFVNGWSSFVIGPIVAAILTGLNVYLIAKSAQDGTFGSA